MLETNCMRFFVLAWLALVASSVHAQSIQKPDTAENFRGLSAPRGKVVWASGTHGTYAKTVDGGLHWKVAQVPNASSLDFRDVEAFNTELAYLLAAGPGEQSRIYKTNNGGAAWDLQFTNHEPKGFFDCMGFWDRDHGIAVGDPVNGRFQLITTVNGGKDWTYISSESLPPAIAGEGGFAASGTCLVTQGKKNVWFATGGTAARVFHSSDQGISWTVAEVQIAHKKASEGIFSLMFRDARNGIAVGGDYALPKSAANNIALTNDGGITWTMAAAENSIYLSSVGYLNKRQLVAVGTDGLMYSDDGGKRWRVAGGEGFNALAIATCDSEPCYLAAGTDGRIKRFWTVAKGDASNRTEPTLKVGMLR